MPNPGKYKFLNSVFNALYNANAFCFTKIDQNLTKIQYFKSSYFVQYLSLQKNILLF